LNVGKKVAVNVFDQNGDGKLDSKDILLGFKSIGNSLFGKKK
jgi:hypothetical protein